MLRGSCACGKVRYELRGELVGPVGHCHCWQCRKHSGASFGTTSAIKAEELRFVEGEERLSSWESSPGTTAAVARIRAVGRGEISEDSYRLFEGGSRPELDAKLTGHDANLLELPVLFYAVGLGIFAAGRVDAVFVGLCRAYVAVRFVHATVHLTGNRPAHRAAVFGTGVILLVVIWVRLLILLSGGGS